VGYAHHITWLKFEFWRSALFIPGHIGISLGTVILLKQMFPGPFARWRVAVLPLCLAALLPDFVDKGLSLTVLRGYHTSRLFAHTLMFSGLAILCAHLWLKSWIPYAWIVLGHLALDASWNHPKTLFFPLLGLGFDRGLPTHDTLGYFYALWLKYLYGPEWFIPEVVGTAIIVIYLYGRQQFQPILLGPSENKTLNESQRQANIVAMRNRL
jgi:hypothetical protein